MEALLELFEETQGERDDLRRQMDNLERQMRLRRYLPPGLKERVVSGYSLLTCLNDLDRQRNDCRRKVERTAASTRTRRRGAKY